jgi:hypothetical protein
MTIFSPQKFHQKAKNPRKRPIVSKFDVPKVPELYAARYEQFPGGSSQVPGFPVPADALSAGSGLGSQFAVEFSHACMPAGCAVCLAVSP